MEEQKVQKKDEERPKDESDRRKDGERSTRDDDRRRDRSKESGSDRKRERSRDDDRRRDRDRDSRRRDSRRSRSREGRSDRDRRRESVTPERRRPKKPSNFTDAPPDMAAMMMSQGVGGIPGLIPGQTILPPGVTPQMMQMLSGVGLQAPGTGAMGGGLGGIDAAQQKIMRELFIGNTPPDTSEAVLMDFLNAAIQQVRLVPTPGNPIVCCRVSEKFAFIELRTIEEANLCLSLTGIPFAGNMLKVGRPSKYTGPNIQASSWQQLTGSAPVQNGTLGVDPDTKLMRELFIGNTTPDMNEVELMNFLGAAMEQVGLTTAPGNPILTTRLSGKFAFVEVRSVEETNNALNMNGIPYLGAYLRVGRPTKYAGPQTPHLDWTELLAKFMAGELGKPGQFNGAGGAGAAATTVLKLGNMVTSEDLVNDEDYNDIMEDTKEECSKFGYVVSVIIPRVNQPGEGQVFVEFSTCDQAAAASQVLSGRTFDGKQVQASYYDEKTFAEGNYGL